MTHPAWETALDAYAARLDAQRAALDTADVDVPAFAPPADLPDLPADLAGRAVALLEDARALEAELADRTAVAGAATAAGTPRATPAFLDQRV